MIQDTNGPFNRITMKSNKRSTMMSKRTGSRNLSTENSFDCSNHSILTAVSRFVRSMKNMSSVVLIPSRLRDLNVGNSTDTSPVSGNTNSEKTPMDLYNTYEMLNQMEKELLWGANSALSLTTSTEMQKQQTSSSNINNWPTSSCGSMEGDSESEFDSMLSDSQYSSGSDQSLSSLVSATGLRTMNTSPSGKQLLGSKSRTEKEDCEQRLHENHSVNEQLNQTHLAIAFKYHLQGLQTILNQLSDNADLLVQRYQQEVEVST